MQELKVCVYDGGTGPRVGSVADDMVYDLNLCCALRISAETKSQDVYRLANTMVPPDLGDFIRGGGSVLAAARQALEWARKDGTGLGPAGEPLHHGARDVRLKAPVLPSSKVVCLGYVYRSHADIAGRPLNPKPIIFYKMSQLSVGPEEWVVLPKHHYPDPVGYGAELTLVIGGSGRSVAEDQAEDLVWGYTILNDVTLKGQYNPLHKEFETCAPIGPWIVPKDQVADSRNLRLGSRLNGKQVQDGNTRDMLFSIPAIIAEVSKWVLLSPGDMIATGDLGVTEPLKPGDIMEAEIEGIGILRNPVKLEE